MDWLITCVRKLYELWVGQSLLGASYDSISQAVESKTASCQQQIMQSIHVMVLHVNSLLR